MSMRRCTAAITGAALSVELNRLARRQSEQAIAQSLRLLRQPVYPDDRVPPAEQ